MEIEKGEFEMHASFQLLALPCHVLQQYRYLIQLLRSTFVDSDEQAYWSVV